MFEKKNLIVNCDVCDTRTMKAEDYENYESIKLNADLLIVNSKSKSVMSRLPILYNTDSTIELSDDREVRLQTINGAFEITPNDKVLQGTILTVNGVLNILPGTSEVLSDYLKINVNGMVRCPKSMESLLHNVNGKVVTYPDDCILLDSHFQPDKYFPLRAKENARYYAAKDIILTDPCVDLSLLAQKHVQFVTKTLLVSESLLEAAIPLFDETTAFVVIPDDYTLIRDDVTLNEALLRQNSTKLFVYGDLTWNAESTVLCSRLEGLLVKGTVFITAKHLPALQAMDAAYDKIELTKGRIIEDQLKLRLDKALFALSPEGIHVKNCVKVTLAEDIPYSTILNDLVLENCVNIHCTPQQESAVSIISKNCAHINTGTENHETDSDEDTPEASIDFTNTKLVNADSYVM